MTRSKIPMAPCFRLLDLPPNLAEQVMKHMNMATLYEMSQLSTRTRLLVRSTAVLNKRKQHLDVCISSTRLISVFCGYDRVDWKFYGKRDSNRMNHEGVRRRAVRIDDGLFGGKGERRELEFVEIRTGLYGCMTNGIQDVIQFFKFIAALFGLGVRELKIFGAQFVHLPLIVATERLQKCDTLLIYALHVYHDEMRTLLGDFRTQKLKILSRTNSGFTVNRPIEIRFLRAWNAAWFSGQQLENLCSDTVLISGCTYVFDIDVNEFLHRWMNRTDGNALICFMVLGKELPYVWNLDIITFGLDSFQRPLEPFSNPYSRSFERESDGQLMNVGIVNDYSMSYLTFHGKYNENATRPNAAAISQNPGLYFSQNLRLLYGERI